MTKYSVKKPFTIFVAVIIVIVFGSVALYKMTPDLLPDIEAPVSVVLTTYPGATSEEIETEITDPVENAVAVLPNVSNITSTSTDNYSIVMLEFTNDVNMDSMTVDLRDKLDAIEGSLPENAAKPIVMKVDMNMMPVTIAAVGMEGKSPAEISTFVKEELDTQLESIEGVASVTKTGMIDEGIQVVLSQDKINDVNDKVQNAIAGKFNEGTGKLKNGINKAKKGSDQIDEGKDSITSGDNEGSAAIQRMEATKQQLLEAKPDMEELLSKYNNETNPTMKAQYAAIMKATLQQMGKEVPASYTDDQVRDAFKAEIDNIAPTIEALNDAIHSIESALNTTYADLAATQSMLQSTVNQLQTTLADIESQKQAAIDSADMTGIITMENVSAILNAQNFSMPAGYVTDGEADILVSVGDKIKDTDELNNLVLFDMGIDGLDPIKVKDIATVSYLADESESYAKINGENGILLSFTKQSTYATATVADNVSAKFKEIEEKYPGVKFTALMDQGEYIHMVINSVAKDLIFGAIFAILVLLFFLRDIRPTVITAVSIPVSVVFALALMYFTGVTLNMMSLSGLAIGVGMLVDNSIVVIENTYRLRSMGYSPVQSAVSGASQVAGAITASTLTTICVFVPIVFVDGLTKQIFMDLALTVTYSLVASLIIALTFVPAVAKGALRKDPGKTVLSQEGKVITWYKRMAAKVLINKKRVVLAALVLLIASTGILLTKGFIFMPSMSSAQVSATVTMPEGSTIKDTTRVNDAIGKDLKKIDGVEDVGIMLTSNMAEMFGVSAGGKETDVTNSSIYVIMDDSKLDQCDEVARVLDEDAEKYNCEIVSTATMDISSLLGGSGVTMKLYGDDLDKLRTSGVAVEDRLREEKAFEEVSDVNENSTDELHIKVDKNSAMEQGLTVAQVYQQVAAKLATDKNATKINQDGSLIDVKIENSTNKKFTVQNLMDMKITKGESAGSDDEGDKKVSLSAIADIKRDASLNVITHDNQKRNLTVTGTLKDGYNVTKVTSDVKKIIADENIVDPDVKVVYSGENEEIMKSMRDMLLMMLVGIVLVYLIMVAQFQSLRSPFIIIFTLPLAFTGGMLALLVSNQTMSVIAMFGFVMLVGIVVNNGIVLVDCINRFRLEGMEMDEAIIQAGAVRMRPVLMTAATTILGLIPLALGIGQGAEMIQPVAITCVGGLLYATVTTLFIIPVMYKWLSRKHMEKIKEEDLEIINV
ncbi:MAG: efflux RND transporter permease subunit [Firmicutes bacterium]|nr:efflux RND transporter permease subunit [Bacillota bacterium]